MQDDTEGLNDVSPRSRSGISRPEKFFDEDEDAPEGAPEVCVLVRLLAGYELGGLGRYMPWCSFCVCGLLIVLATAVRLATSWATLLVFEDVPIRPSTLVQGHYAFQAATRMQPMGCADEDHRIPTTCNQDPTCRWSPLLSRCLLREACHAVPAVENAAPMLHEKGGEAVSMTVLYEATDTDLLQYWVLERILAFETELLTTAGGATFHDEASPWSGKWCMKAFPEGGGKGKCAAVSSAAGYFTTTGEARKVISQQVQDGYGSHTLSKCLCTMEPGSCRFCNSQGNVDQRLLEFLKAGTISNNSHWMAKLSNCILESLPEAPSPLPSSTPGGVRRRLSGASEALLTGMMLVNSSRWIADFVASRDFELAFVVQPRAVPSQASRLNILSFETQGNSSTTFLAASFESKTTRLNVEVSTRTGLVSCIASDPLPPSWISSISILVWGNELRVAVNETVVCTRGIPDRLTEEDEDDLSLWASGSGLPAAGANLGDVVVTRRPTSVANWQELSPLGLNRVALASGGPIGDPHGLYDMDLESCQRTCEATSGCYSVSHCQLETTPICFLFDKQLIGGEESQPHDYCTTYFRNVSSQVPAGAASDVCSGISAPQPKTALEVQAWLTGFCAKRPSCELSHPAVSDHCSSRGYFPPTDFSATLASGEDHNALLARMCASGDLVAARFRGTVLPRSFDCSGSRETQLLRTTFFPGREDPTGVRSVQEFQVFSQSYANSKGGWLERAQELARKAEEATSGRLRVIVLSSATIEAQLEEVVSADSLRCGLTVLVIWLLLWWQLESLFLSLCAMLCILVSLSAAIVTLVIFGRRLPPEALLAGYVGVGKTTCWAVAMSSAWKSSAALSEHPFWAARFEWAFRRVAGTCTAATACCCCCFLAGSICASLPQVAVFCQLCMLVLFWDTVFSTPFIAMSIVVYERICVPIRDESRLAIDAGEGDACVLCCDTGCCWGLCRAAASACWRRCTRLFCLSLGLSHDAVGLGLGGDAPATTSFVGKVLVGKLIPCLFPWRITWLCGWTMLVIATGACAGFLLSTQSRRTPLGRPSVDVLRALDLLSDQFTSDGVPTVSFIFGLRRDEPVAQWGDDKNPVWPAYDAADVELLTSPQGQRELLAMCRVPDAGVGPRARCETPGCLTFGPSRVGTCRRHETLWRKFGVVVQEDALCSSARYCFMEEFAQFWASTIGNCYVRAKAGCLENSKTCRWDADLNQCYAVTSEEDFPGLEAKEFTALLGGKQFQEYRQRRLAALRGAGLSAEAATGAKRTGFTFDTYGRLQLAWISFNTTLRDELSQESNEAFYERWERLRSSVAPSLAGFHTADIYLFLAEQREVLLSTVLSLGIGLVFALVMLLATVWNWQVGLLSVVSNVVAVVVILGFFSIIDCQLGPQETSLVIAGFSIAAFFSTLIYDAFTRADQHLDHHLDRHDRVKHSFLVFGGAIWDCCVQVWTSSIMLMFCNFQALFQFGSLLFLVATLSWLLLVFFVVPLIFVLGPEGADGELCCFRLSQTDATFAVGPPADVEAGLTEDQKGCGPAVFSVHDADGDGKLNRAQLAEALLELHQSSSEGKARDECRREVDMVLEQAVFEEPAGLVTLTEFNRLFEALSAPRPADRDSEEASLAAAVDPNNMGRIVKGKKTTKRPAAKASKKPGPKAAAKAASTPAEPRAQAKDGARKSKKNPAPKSRSRGSRDEMVTAGEAQLEPSFGGMYYDGDAERAGRLGRSLDELLEYSDAALPEVSRRPRKSSSSKDGKKKSRGSATTEDLQLGRSSAGSRYDSLPGGHFDVDDSGYPMLPDGQSYRSEAPEGFNGGMPLSSIGYSEFREAQGALGKPVEHPNFDQLFRDPAEATPAGRVTPESHMQDEALQPLAEPYVGDDLEIPAEQLGEEDRRQAEEAALAAQRQREQEEEARRQAEEAHRLELEAAQRAEEERRRQEKMDAEARARAEADARRAATLQQLAAAAQSRDLAQLRRAIADAEGQQLEAPELQQAKIVLNEEEHLQQLRDSLRALRSCLQPEPLREALSTAAAQGLGEDEPILVELQALLELLVACGKRNVDELETAMVKAKDVGVDPSAIQAAQAILDEEIPKQKARLLLSDACSAEVKSKEALSSAIEAAKAAGLSEQDYAEALELLRREEEKDRLLAEVKQSIADSKSADMEDMVSVKQAEEHLKEAIAKALQAGVGEADLSEAELVRKKLHNKAEDLKGSIRVFCRIRPLSEKEKAQGDEEITKQCGPMKIQVLKEDQDAEDFEFNAVFTPGTQDEIFEDCKDLVQSAVDGYNVTLFAYGQTGAGKTFTMAGVPGQLGICPRTIIEVFDVIEAQKARFDFSVTGSMLELYQQNLLDLLAVGQDSKLKKKALNVRMEKSGMIVVENLIEEPCNNAEELQKLVDRGTDERKTGSTEMNAGSSRSHLIVLVKIQSTNKETKQKLQGKILIVDLAGSERLKKSQTTDEMKKESIEINKSLTALGDVISSLAAGQKQVPYRNHKLTQLMQDSIGGTAKTLMFVNASPASSNLEETVNSLRYAARAKNITNTTAKQQAK